MLLDHLHSRRQIIFLLGPRQVGKTTIGHMCLEEFENSFYFSWDNLKHRELILSGPEAIAKFTLLDVARPEKTVIFFDEIHKYNDWKIFLKGFFDTYEAKVKIIVSGSAKLEAFNYGGESLMGRYFSYRIHPLSLAEMDQILLTNSLIRPPRKPEKKLLSKLLDYGGFPEPLAERDSRFLKQWQNLRRKQLIREDLRDLTKIIEIDKVELLTELLRDQSGQLSSYLSFSKKLRATDVSVKKWISVLRSLYFCFSIKPWSKNVTRSLLKEPKFYLWDWSLCHTEGAKAENLIASHLLKACHFWTDHGLGEFELFFLRDKEKREVDFLISYDRKPWLLLEVKSSYKQPLSKSLLYFNDLIKPKYCLQVAMDLAWNDIDCFSLDSPAIVSAETLLSQLI